MNAERPRLVLASASAARARLLRAAGLDFAVRPARVDEEEIRVSMRAERAKPADIAGALAEIKALRVSAIGGQVIVIGADQVLTCGEAWFDKPRDISQARAQLLALKGKTHKLTSAIAVARGGAVLWRHAETAELTMREFSGDFLDRYLASAGTDAMSSVGAYRLEGLGAQLFERIEGDYFAILGLPLLPLLAFLREHGLVAR